MKKSVSYFQNDIIAQGRLSMLRCVFPKKNEEQIMAEALDLFWEKNLEQINNHVQSLSVYAKYSEPDTTPK